MTSSARYSSEADEQLATDFINNAQVRYRNSLIGVVNDSACDAYGVVSCFANKLNPNLPAEYQLLASSGVDPLLEGLRIRDEKLNYVKNSQGGYEYYPLGATVSNYFGYRPDHPDVKFRQFENKHDPVSSGGNLLYPENMIAGIRTAVVRAIEKARSAWWNGCRIARIHSKRPLGDLLDSGRRRRAVVGVW